MMWVAEDSVGVEAPAWCLSRVMRRAKVVMIRYKMRIGLLKA